MPLIMEQSAFDLDESSNSHYLNRYYYDYPMPYTPPTPPTPTASQPLKGLVYIPALFESLHKQLEQFCICSASSSNQVYEEYSEYFGDMDMSQTAQDLLASLPDEIVRQVQRHNMDQRRSRRFRHYHNNPAAPTRCGGVEESKEEECEGDMMDDSMVVRHEFYQRPASWFASTALLEEPEDEDSTCYSHGHSHGSRSTGFYSKSTPKADNRCMASAAPPKIFLKPRINGMDASEYPLSAFQPYERVNAIAIDEEDDYDTTTPTKQLDKNLGTYYFSNIDCYETEQQPQSPPPISPADTYTTVSLCHSMDSLMDNDEDEDEEDNDDDDEDVILVERHGSPERVAECFRPEALETPPAGLTTPYLLRMKPQHYIHGVDSEEDGLYTRLATDYATTSWNTSKCQRLSVDLSLASSSPLLMPELR